MAARSRLSVADVEKTQQSDRLTRDDLLLALDYLQDVDDPEVEAICDKIRRITRR